MKNIVLINPFSSDISGVNVATIEPPLGIAYIGAVLEKAGHRCQIIDANLLQIPKENILSRLLCVPDIIGISANITTFKAALGTAGELRKNFFDTPIIFGGPHPSVLPERTLENNFIDAVVIGEGEITMLEIVTRLEDNKELFNGVDGLAYKRNDKIIVNNNRELLADLDTLPFPAYHLLPEFKRYKSRSRKAPVAAILTSRGCPFQCTFCNKTIFTSRLRVRSAESVLSEVDWLVKNYRIRQLDILDDNFNFDLSRAKRILDLLIAQRYNLAINLQNGVRIDNIDLELLDKMKEAGVFKIGFGIETAAPHIQKKIKKITDLDKVIFITKEARKRGILVYANFILGLPGDSPLSMQLTIDFAKRMGPDIANFMIALPLPGTELYDEVKKDGHFLVNAEQGVEEGFYAHKVFYELGPTRALDVLKYYRKAYCAFYFNIVSIARLIRSIRSVTELFWFRDAIVDLAKNILKG